jgi:hypothetical protein
MALLLTFTGLCEFRLAQASVGAWPSYRPYEACSGENTSLAHAVAFDFDDPDMLSPDVHV